MYIFVWLKTCLMLRHFNSNNYSQQKHAVVQTVSQFTRGGFWFSNSVCLPITRILQKDHVSQVCLHKQQLRNNRIHKWVATFTACSGAPTKATRFWSGRATFTATWGSTASSCPRPQSRFSTVASCCQRHTWTRRVKLRPCLGSVRSPCPRRPVDCEPARIEPEHKRRKIAF